MQNLERGWHGRPWTWPFVRGVGRMQGRDNEDVLKFGVM